MVDVLSKITSIFERLGLPYFRQGSLGDDEPYPQSFFTFWNLGTPLQDFADNKENSIVTNYTIYYYTDDPSTIYSKLNEFLGIAKSEGFICSDLGQDASSDVNTHTGRRVNITYKEYLA